MMLLSRVNRLEQRHTSGNPLKALTDDELEAAIASVRARIEASTGMSDAVYAKDLSGRIIDGTLSDDVDPETARRFVAAILSSVNGKTRSLEDRHA
jgi:hypothetical protein